MARSWFYFGCDGQSGHHLHDERLSRIHGERGFERFDGGLCPPAAEGLYIAALTRLGGLGYSALAFWDQTIDSRPGSNSIFFAPSLIVHPVSMWALAQHKFPAITKPLPAVDLSRAIAQHDAAVAAYRIETVAA